MSLLLIKASFSFKFVPHNSLGKVGICSDNFEELQFGFFFFFSQNRAPLLAFQVLDGSKAKYTCEAELLALQL